MNSNQDTRNTASTAGTPRREKGGLFVTAVVLARRGRYAEASKTLLDALDRGDCSEVDALDLQARVYAQQGLHLQAESCWRQAKHLNGTNPAYDEALRRLQSSRLLTGRLCQLSATLAAAAALGLLLWQALVVNPATADRLRASDDSVALIRKDIAAVQANAEAGNQEVTRRMAHLGGSVKDLEVRLSQDLGAMPTAAGIAQDYEALVARMDAQRLTLEALLERRITNLDARRAEYDAMQAEQLSIIETAISELGTAVAALEDATSRQIVASYESLDRQVEQMGMAIQRDMKFLAASSEMAAVRETVAELQVRIDGVAAAVKQLSSAGAVDAASVGSHDPTKGPTTQPATQQP